MTQETALVNQEELDQVRALSGESNQANFEFTPIIQIDNSMVEEEIRSGRKTKVRVEPRLVITTKNDKNEYVDTPYPNSVFGTILKVRYMVDKKYEEELRDIPYFRSNEFDNFQNSKIILRSGDNVAPPMTYKQFKERFAKRYTLWSIVYFLVDVGDGQKKVYKLKMKGVSRSNFWDYMNSFGQNDSMTLYQTEVSFDVDDMGEMPFNYMCFDKRGKTNLNETMKYLRELNEAIQAFTQPEANVKAIEGEIQNNAAALAPAGDEPMGRGTYAPAGGSAPMPGTANKPTGSVTTALPGAGGESASIEGEVEEGKTENLLEKAGVLKGREVSKEEADQMDDEEIKVDKIPF